METISTVLRAPGPTHEEPRFIPKDFATTPLGKQNTTAKHLTFYSSFFLFCFGAGGGGGGRGRVAGWGGVLQL